MSAWNLDRYRAVFAVPAFRRFWLGYTGSTLGDSMTRVALTWWVWESTHSAKALGLLTICYTGPILAGGLAAGWLLDRFDRTRVMLVDNAIRGLVIGALPLLHILGLLELWHAYVAAGVYGLLMMISLAGGPSLVPSLVPRALLPTANALETLSFTLSGIVGPPLAGVLASRIGAPNVLMLDAASYLGFVIALAGVARLRAGAETAHEPAVAVASRTRDGFLFIARNPILRSTTLMYMVANVGEGLMQVWLPLLAVSILGGGAELYGLLLGAAAVGEVASSVAAGAVTLPVTLGRAICGALVLAGGSVALLAMAPPAWLAAACLALFGFFAAPLTIWAQTLRMAIIPPEFRGRVFALLRTMMQGATPAGGAVAGWLVPALGVPAGILLTATCFAAAGLGGTRVHELVRAGSPARPASEGVEAVEGATPNETSG